MWTSFSPRQQNQARAIVIANISRHSNKTGYCFAYYEYIIILSGKNLENSKEILSSTAERLLHLLKTRGPQQATDAGAVSGITAEAARQQLTKLPSLGLVKAHSQSKGVGRPNQYWQLTQTGHARFPDTHAALTVQLLNTGRQVFGEQAVDHLIDSRTPPA